ncbi:hypothetical protein HZC21_03505 [Candidatus Peregrinibacteria bacterium]|nr:hypothetical protein [Candidatus Peregrinibacteria bacterium]
MDNALALALYMGPVYLMLGLSILLYAKAWSHLFGKWAEDHFGLFTLMLLEGILGVYLINAYNVWEWNVWLLVTLTGWWLAVESVFYFIIPGNPIKVVLGWAKQMWVVYLMGVVSVVVGAVLTYYSYLV